MRCSFVCHSLKAVVCPLLWVVAAPWLLVINDKLARLFFIAQAYAIHVHVEIDEMDLVEQVTTVCITQKNTCKTNGNLGIFNLKNEIFTKLINNSTIINEMSNSAVISNTNRNDGQGRIYFRGPY